MDRKRIPQAILVAVVFSLIGVPVSGALAHEGGVILALSTILIWPLGVLLTVFGKGAVALILFIPLQLLYAYAIVWLIHAVKPKMKKSG